jgi:hypothetical protein
MLSKRIVLSPPLVLRGRAGVGASPGSRRSSAPHLAKWPNRPSRTCNRLRAVFLRGWYNRNQQDFQIMKPPNMQFLSSEYTYFGIAFGIVIGSNTGPLTGPLRDRPAPLFTFFFLFGLILWVIGKLRPNSK